ncbi:MAG TPA: PH domain-containing protein [Candidatus Andersenbacteria bacterium]|nr:PH domain-containing protein [Candidatus Andersenbacteria bacterium]
MMILQEGEHIIATVRKHWISIFSHATIMIILAALPITLVAIIRSMFLLDISQSLIIFSAAAWILFVWIMFVAMWTNYYLDMLVITNKRIVDMEQFILFSRDEVTIPIDRIEDVKIDVKGFFPTILKYGNIQIQTAGAKRETAMNGIRNPENIKQQIDALLQTISTPQDYSQ